MRSAPLDNHSSTAKKSIRLFRFYGVPTLMLLVAVFQMYQVKVNGLTRWKGGGYGMYSEYHANMRQVLFRDSTGAYIPLQKIPDFALKESRLFISPKKLRSLSERIQKETNERLGIEVWIPSYELQSLEMTRIPISVYYPQTANDQE